MIPEANDRAAVDYHVRKVREALDDPRLHDAIDRAASQIAGSESPRTKIADILPPDPGAIPSSGGAPAGVPYLSRDPLVSLVQSHVEEAIAHPGVDPSHPESLWSKIVHSIEHALHINPGSFTPDDPNWYVFIAKGVLDHLARGTHHFNAHPAEHEIVDDARLVVVGDWGTGLPPARDVAMRMREHIASALAVGRQAHVIHLGDVYYSGLASEDERRFLKYWPVTSDQADAGVTSWSLNGNHDMYSGGFGYFDTLLADPRFARQRSADGSSTSFFRLRSPSWDFVGLDTAWDPDVTSQGQVGVLKDPQAAYLLDVAAQSRRKITLFSHHQLASVYETSDLGHTLPTKLAPLLSSERITAWWWGHEHRAIAYGATPGVRFPRCLGNGGVPVEPDPDRPGSVPAITWRSTRTVHHDGHDWVRSGFAVLDLDGATLQARYFDDDGAETFREQVS